MKQSHTPHASGRRTPTPFRNINHTAVPPQDQPAPEDQRRDQRLAEELALKAGDTVAARHRNGSTAIESESDGVPEDEDVLDAAVDWEADERRKDKRRHLSNP